MSWALPTFAGSRVASNVRCANRLLDDSTPSRFIHLISDPLNHSIAPRSSSAAK